MISQNSEIHRIQRSFRCVMDAAAHPGRMLTLPVDAGRPVVTGLDASLDTVVRVFVDQAVSFAYLGDAVRERAISSETRSHAMGVAQAQFVIVEAGAGDSSVEYAIGRAHCGTLLAPERGATVVVGCGALSSDCEDGSIGFAVSGPGVAGENVFFCDSDAWWRSREDRHDEYPCGIEVVLVDVRGRIVVIPRTSKVVRLESIGQKREAARRVEEVC